MTMRKALDTSVVTCSREGRKEKGKADWRVSLPPSHPWHQPHEGPRTAKKVASYRNHPPVPEP